MLEKHIAYNMLQIASILVPESRQITSWQDKARERIKDSFTPLIHEAPECPVPRPDRCLRHFGTLGFHQKARTFQ